MHKQNQQIYGIPVVGTLSDLSQVLEKFTVDEVIIAIPSAPGRVVRLVADICRLKNIPFRTMPGIYELLGGSVNVNRLREVDITDLLRRQPTYMNEEIIGSSISGKIVLITGAGGSIGKELCRQISRWGPSELIMVGHGENSIFESLLDMKESFSGLSIIPIIADMRDKNRLRQIVSKHKPQVVFHAAAHKHVPMMELNIEEAVTNNILGTKNLVEICVEYDVEKFVMISTDKAIRPKNVMGASKRIAELIVLKAARTNNKEFCVVRFGNVLGSRGSVVPLFKRQIARGGPITITHPDMKRYFMTIPEAVSLVLQASTMGEGGEVFVLDMGEPVMIKDVAEELIRIHGLKPYKDIDIEFTGLRPGEKLFEEILTAEEGTVASRHEKVFVARNSEKHAMEDVEIMLDDFRNLVADPSIENDGKVRDLLKKYVKHYEK